MQGRDAQGFPLEEPRPTTMYQYECGPFTFVEKFDASLDIGHNQWTDCQRCGGIHKLERVKR